MSMSVYINTRCQNPEECTKNESLIQIKQQPTFSMNTSSSIAPLIPKVSINPYPTAFPYGNGMVLHFYQQQDSSTTKTVHKVINKGLKTYV